MELSVLTWNIHKGFRANSREFVLHEMRDQLRASGADVALCQEVIGEHEKHAGRISNWPATSQYEFLADEVWHHHAYGKNAISDGRHHGNAILSKYPLSGNGNTNISPFRKASRSILYCDIVVPETDKRIHLACIHLGLTGYERRRQLHRLNAHLARARAESDAIIVGGDFNDWTGRQVSRHLDPDLDMQEAFHQFHGRFARTFPAGWSFLRMDRLYYSGLTALECHCLNGPEWRVLSDHVPLLARFRL